MYAELLHGAIAHQNETFMSQRHCTKMFSHINETFMWQNYMYMYMCIAQKLI